MHDIKLIDFVPQYDERGMPLKMQGANYPIHSEVLNELGEQQVAPYTLFVDPELATEQKL